MTTGLQCLHGHVLRAPESISGFDSLTCPLCGTAITGDRLRGYSHGFALTYLPGAMTADSFEAKDINVLSRPAVEEHGATDDADVSTDFGARTLISDSLEALSAEEFSLASGSGNRPATESTTDATEPAKTQPDAKLTAPVTPPSIPRVEVLDELGRGGMGIVYRAFDERLGTHVALKTLQRMGPENLLLFKQEFRALADIAHPNLASLYELHSDGTTWCLTMELLEGVEFLEYVWSGLATLDPARRTSSVAEPPNDQPRLTDERLARLQDVLQQMALGLSALHRAGILHSDIKPSNVFVTKEGRLVLLDFGLVSEITRDEEGRIPQGIQGTPLYMSPEQVACEPLGGASDWYAVGVMLYEVLTGCLPIEGKAVSVMLRKQKERPRPPIERSPSVPQDLSDLCMAMLDIDPAIRPTAEDVLRAIGAASSIEQVATTSPQQTTSLDLVGREKERALLNQSLEEVRAGANRSVFVYGQSGMGKSALIRSFIDPLRHNKQTILLEGRCYEQESVPFKALDSLVDSLASYLSGTSKRTLNDVMPEDTLPLLQLFPALGQVPGADDDTRPTIESADQPELRRRATMALRELLRRLATRKTLVLYIDDMQWGDEDSSNLLADVMRPPKCPSLLLLGSYRREDAETSPALETLNQAYLKGEHQPHRTDIGIEALSAGEARRLALMLIGESHPKADVFADQIARESGGSPFFVWELAQHVKHIQDASTLEAGSLELDDVIWSRVQRLPAETQQLLEVFAVSGRPMEATEAYQVIQRPNGPSLLAQLRTNDFIRITDSDGQTLVETYHDRIRESVVDHLPAESVREHNLGIATVIERNCDVTLDDIHAHIATTPDFAEPKEAMRLSRAQWQRVFDLAYFLDAAGQSERALPFALIAAEQAVQQNAFDVAEHHYEIARRGYAKAVEISPTHLAPALRFRVAEGLGNVFITRGKYDRAHELLEKAGALTTESLPLARIEGRRGDVYYKSGAMDLSCDFYHRALRSLGSIVPSNILTQLVAMTKEGFVQLLHTYLPNLMAGRKDAHSERGKLELFRASLYDGLGYPYFFLRGPVPTLWTHLRHMNLAERYAPGPELGRAYAYHAVVMTAFPMAERGQRYAARAFEIHKDKGDRLGMGKACSYRGMSLMTLGRFREATESAREAARLLDEAGDVWEANMARIMLTYPLYYLGELEEACQTARQVLRVGYETGDFMAVACALFFGVPTSPDFVEEGLIQSELERKRLDPLSASAILQARGLEFLHREDNPVEAARLIGDSLQMAFRRGFRNPFVFCGYSWHAEALRRVAEREPPGPSRSKAIKVAKRASRRALFETWLYRTSRARALREMGIISAMEGKAAKARKYLLASQQVAESQEAVLEAAKTKLAMGQAGLEFDWQDAPQHVDEAESTIASITSFSS